MTISEKLMKIQTEIKAPKNLYNSFGKYKYRNAEGICEAVKPYLVANKCALTLSDEIYVCSDRVYVKANATIIDIENGETISVSALAREAEEKKGMDDSQITGTASSYARKYALNGLFLLDDTKDADSDEYKQTIDAKNEIENVENAKINSVKVKVIEDVLKQKNIPIENILKPYKVKKLADLTEKQFSHINMHWKEVAEWKPKEG